VSGSTPADLAVAFRGLPRRLRDALEGCEDPWSGHDRVTRVLTEAATLLHCRPEPVAVADAIEAREIEDWNDSDLDRLRALALQLGSLVREAEAWRDDSPTD
jgi:hypothetical protein